MTEVRRKIFEQYPLFTPQDLIPVPCNPDALCMAYALKIENEVFPMTHLINPEDLLNNSKNTIVFEHDEKLKSHMLNLFSTGISVDCAEDELNELMCCLPKVKSETLNYDNLFRILIMNFMDAHDFDVRAVKKSCVHIVSDKMKIIPFETMNLFYRDHKIDKIRETLKF